MLAEANFGKFQDGVVGMAVGKGSSLSNVVIKNGLARVGGHLLEQLVANEAVDLAVPPAVGTHYIYVNAPDALDADGVALAMLSADKCEADKTRAAINGSNSVTHGRSIKLAKITTTAPAATITIALTWADGDDVTATINGHAVVCTLGTGEGASVTTVATALAAAINADTTSNLIVHATHALGVVTVTGLNAVAYTLTTAYTTAGNGTSTASAGALAGGGIIAATGIDNTVKLSESGAAYSTRVNAG